jgi:hypothetical protein
MAAGATCSPNRGDAAPREDYMSALRFSTAAALGFIAHLAITPAHALTMAECSAKYKAAQAAGTLKGMKWNDFRKAECGTDAAAAAAPAATTQKAKAPDAGEPTPETTEKAAEPADTKMPAPKGVVFPKAVSTKYASEKPAKARMHTCLDQYRINKANNALGGLVWIQKGGGYYSLCNTKLKS